MGRLIAALTLILWASPAFAQPTPCTPNSGTWTVTTNAVTMKVCASDGQSWLTVGGGGGDSVPAGANILIDSGTCPAGYEENTALNGKTIIGTIAANGDVGTTGGSDSITSVLNHTHTVNVTDPGHVHPEGYRNTGTAGTAGVQGASTANNASIAGGVLSATTGITASTVNPAGGVASIDNRSAFVKVIICKKS